MRRPCSIIFLLSLFGCKQANKKVVDRYPNGQVKTEYIYSNKGDTSDYVCKIYYESGVIKHEAQIANNNFIGEKKSFFENGILERLEKLHYPTPLYDSLYDCYIINFRPNGIKLSEYQYIDNKINGLRKDYDSLGNLERIQEYINDKLNGKEVIYFASGKIKELYFLKNDSLDGFEIHFQESGDTLKWYHNGEDGVNGVFYKKWLDNNKILTGQYGDSNRSYVVWKWSDKNNKILKTKVDKQINGKYIAPE